MIYNMRVYVYYKPIMNSLSTDHHENQAERVALRIVNNLCLDMQKEILSFVSPTVLYRVLSIGDINSFDDVDVTDYLKIPRRIITSEKYNTILGRLNFHRRGYDADDRYEDTSESIRNFRMTGKEDREEDEIQKKLSRSRHRYTYNQLSSELKRINFVVSKERWYKLNI